MTEKAEERAQNIRAAQAGGGFRDLEPTPAERARRNMAALKQELQLDAIRCDGVGAASAADDPEVKARPTAAQMHERLVAETRWTPEDERLLQERRMRGDE